MKVKAERRTYLKKGVWGMNQKSNLCLVLFCFFFYLEDLAGKHFP